MNIQIVGSVPNNGIRFNIWSDFDDQILFEYLNDRVQVMNVISDRLRGFDFGQTDICNCRVAFVTPCHIGESWENVISFLL